MWTVTLRSSTSEPVEYTLKPGTNSIGRNPDNDMVLHDEIASRAHAILDFNVALDLVTILDLNSTNGTYVNRERLTQPRNLLPNDSIRIGETILTLANSAYTSSQARPPHIGTHALTRDFMIETIDQQAVLMYEAAQRLNTVLDLETALHEVADLMKQAMGADKCELVLAEQFSRLAELGFPTSIAQMAIDQKAAIVVPNMEDEANPKIGQSASLYHVRSVLCVPVMNNDEVLGLTYIYKTNPEYHPFDERDLQLAVAISHQAGLTITRMTLLKKFEAEQRIHHLLERFLAPNEAEYVLDYYTENGHLPEMTEHKVTVLFADMVDSTALAESLGIDRFSELLGQYYQELTTAVFKNGGLIKFWGDSMMAVFGLGKNQENNEESAVFAGLEIIERIKSINQANQDTALQIGVGINTGKVLAGYMGSHDRVEFTVLGDTVNIAYRLESQARPNRLFAGPATVASLFGKFNTHRLGSVTLKGRTQPLQIYEVTK
jgi:adenylate cyclase